MLRDLPPIARKLYGLLENDRFEAREGGEECQAYWLGPHALPSVGSTCRRERDNVAAVMRACEAIEVHGPALPLRPRAGGARGRRGHSSCVVWRAARARTRLARGQTALEAGAA